MELKSIDPDYLYSVSYTSSRVGRKLKRTDTQIRQLFFSRKRANHVMQPKKEYVRCRLIRGHKRANRQISSNILPTKTLNRFNPQNPRAAYFWNKMRETFSKDRIIFSHALTENGPKTDGKSKRRVPAKDLQNSFNLSFCQSYFTPLSIRESYYYYIELIYSELDPAKLTEKLELHCCHGEHSVDCVLKWSILKRYMQQGLLLDLDLEPFVPSQTREFSVPAFPDFLNKSVWVEEGSTDFS